MTMTRAEIDVIKFQANKIYSYVFISSQVYTLHICSFFNAIINYEQQYIEDHSIEKTSNITHLTK